jgi:hypothetical protein
LVQIKVLNAGLPVRWNTPFRRIRQGPWRRAAPGAQRWCRRRRSGGGGARTHLGTRGPTGAGARAMRTLAARATTSAVLGALPREGVVSPGRGPTMSHDSMHWAKVAAIGREREASPGRRSLSIRQRSRAWRSSVGETHTGASERC